MTFLREIITSFFLLSFIAASAVTVYDVPVRFDKQWSVYVSEGGEDWLQVPVAPVRVANCDDEGRTKAVTVSMAWLDSDKPVQVKAVKKGGCKEACVRPLSKGIDATIEADSVICFTVDKPMNISVEADGEIFSNLHLFVNPEDTARPTAKEIKKNKIVYFGPGEHTLPGDTMRITSGQRVYIDGGAWIHGMLIVDGEDDVKIAGRGVVMPRGRGEGIYIKRSSNVDVEGVIVTQLPVGESTDVNVTNVKSISSYGNADGLNVFASSRVTYRDCFCRNSDDCTTVYATRKGFNGSSRDILMERSVLWADIAHPIFVGLHGNPEQPDTIERITYRDIDILDHHENQIDYQGCLAINVGDDNLVKDILFDNIRVEDFRKGQLLNVRIFYNKKYCTAPGRGIHGVTFRNIDYRGQGEATSIIAGYNDERTVDGIIFDGLHINGRHIHDELEGKPKWYKTSDYANIFIGEHVGEVIFK